MFLCTFLRPFTNCSVPALVAGRTILRIAYTVVRPRLVGARLMCSRVDATEIMNTASKLGPHTQTDRGTCPGVGLCVYFKRRCTTSGDGGGAHAIFRGGARCASQVFHRCAQAVSRGAARCALHVHGRGARTDACGRSQVKLILSPKQRAKPAASRTRTCTNAAVRIASGECPSRF